jgi:phosphate transport system substrate-binding protein
VAALGVAVAIAAPAAAADPAPPLKASGTGSALGTMRRLAAAFARASPGDRLEIVPSLGTSGAIKAVVHGALDLALLGRPLEPAEKALGLASFPYARTPFVFVAGPRTGITAITAEEALRLYRGEVTQWPSGERVRLVLRPRMDADTAVLRGISREMAAAVDAALAREGMLVGATNQESDDLVARTPGALGQSTLTQIVAEDEPLRPLAWDGAAPTLANLASGAYPLSKTLELAVRASPSPAVRRFLGFLRSPAARGILEETGNLPLALPPE